jgi:hypothetical protein
MEHTPFLTASVPVQIDLRPVYNYARFGVVTRLSDIRIPGTGWTKNGIDHTMPLLEQVRQAIETGATCFTFEIVVRDLFGRTSSRFLDFALCEITVQP